MIARRRVNPQATWFLFFVLAQPPGAGAQTLPHQETSEGQRKKMVERGLEYLFSVQKEGAVGESRKKAVSALFLLANLSSGVLPSHPAQGQKLKEAYEWIIQNSSPAFFGGSEEPHEDHALCALAFAELVGTSPSEPENQKLYERARTALAFSLQIQDKGSGGEHFGGWRPNDRTRENSRVLTAWFLMQLRASEWIGMDVPKSSLSRAVEFVKAGQKFPQAAKPGEKGGFSYGPQGLDVLHPTAAGAAVLAFFEPDEERLLAARDWMARQRPPWYGPHFYESHFFAARSLYRCRRLDNGQVFNAYFSRIVQILEEQQLSDGAFPFPPGEGGPIVAMGKAYSTAMAILILNVDRGFLPIDQ